MFSGLAISQETPIRRWTTLVSFTLEVAVVAIFLVYPLFHLDSLQPVLHPLFLPLSTESPGPVQHETAHSHASPGPYAIIVNSHSVFFGKPQTRTNGTNSIEVPNVNGLGAGNAGVLNSIMDSFSREVPRPTVQAAPVRRSVVMEGNLIHKIEPQYPVIAKQLHIQGAVVLKAFISRNGTIEHMQVERGQPLLAHAALDAVRQWRYRPYYLNNEPIEVETEITVNFVLDGATN